MSFVTSLCPSLPNSIHLQSVLGSVYLVPLPFPFPHLFNCYWLSIKYILLPSHFPFAPPVQQLATKFNQQFNTSKLGRHTSSRETRVVTRETKRKPLEMVRTFTTDLVMKAIKSCRNIKAFGPDKLSIFHLKHLGPRAIEYITALFNLSATTCRIPAIWKSSLIIPIPNPGKDTSQGTSYRPISLICPAAKVLESLFLP